MYWLFLIQKADVILSHYNNIIIRRTLMNLSFKPIYTLLLFGSLLNAQTYPFPKGDIITSDGYTLAQNSDDGKRIYLQGATLEPILGFTYRWLKTKMGLEASVSPLTLKGANVHLTINLGLQQQIETMLDTSKEKYEADEVLAMVMKSNSGKVLAMASSNRYDPNNITKKDIPSMYPKFTRYPYEPGSVLKPLSLAIALNHKRVTPQTQINTHNGRMHLNEKVFINDDKKFASMTVTDIIVHSSNVGISQIAWMLTGKEFHDGLLSFGLSRLSGIDLLKEEAGILKDANLMKNKMYRANSSYGYGMLISFVQLLKAYSVFDNDGISVTPQLVDYIEDDKGIQLVKSKKQYAINKESAYEIHQILKEVVKRGTGINAQYAGLEIGGKTGTAYISKNGKYVREFHSSFYGFANDDKGHKYTIGVMIIRAKAPNMHYASQSAVPVFGNIVEQLVSTGYLIPDNKEGDD